MWPPGSWSHVTRGADGRADVKPGAALDESAEPQAEVEGAPPSTASCRVGWENGSRRAAVQARAIGRVRGAGVALGLVVRGEVESPLVGPAGNREFFLHFERPA